MKTKKLLSLMLAAVLLLSCAVIPTMAENTASTPKVYANYTFDGLDPAKFAVTSNILTYDGENFANGAFAIADTVTSVEKQYGSNNALVITKAKGSTAQSNAVLYLDKTIGNLANCSTDVVYEFDCYIDGFDGANLPLFNWRTADNSIKWNDPDVNMVETWRVQYRKPTETGYASGNSYTAANHAIPKGAWVTYSFVLHADANGDTLATYDLYQNGVLVIDDAFVRRNFNQIALPAYKGTSAVSEDMKIMIDNIQIYEAGAPMSNAALGLPVIPQVYANYTFDDLDAEKFAVTNNYITYDGQSFESNLFRVEDTITTVENRYGNNNALVLNKKKGSTAAGNVALHLQNTIFPNGSSFAKFDSDVVYEFDFYIDGYDGTAASFMNYRRLGGWVHGDLRSILSDQNRLSYRLADSTTANGWTAKNSYTSAANAIPSAQWVTVSYVIHPDTDGDAVTSYDLYMNGKLIIDEGFMFNDFNQIALPAFKGTTAVAEDMKIMIDNIQIYTSDKPLSDAALGITHTGAQFAGVQDSGIGADGETNIRFIATVDSLNYRNVGFDIVAKYTENNIEKTKTEKLNSRYVFDSILAHTDAGIETYSAADLGGNYLYALTLHDVPANIGDVVFEISTYSVAVDGNETVHSVTRIVYTNGMLTSIVTL